MRHLRTLIFIFAMLPLVFVQAASSKKKSTRTIQSTVEATLNGISFPDSSVPENRFRDTYTHLSDTAFDAKMKEALQGGPLFFFRSFVNTYYTDLAASNDSKNIIYCLGDSHLENFGFMNFKGTTQFVFNDLDDSGPCPLEYDVLRYFVALDMAFSDKVLTNEMIEEYIAVVNNKKIAESLPASSFPDLQKKQKKNVAKYTDGKQFIAHGDLILLPATQKTNLLAELAKVPLLSSVKILDLAEVSRVGGGSGGLQRYWIFIDGTTGPEILELKQLSRPGTSYGNWVQPTQTEAQHLDMAKKYIWKDSPEYYDAITFQNLPFLIRSRTRDSSDITILSNKDLKQLLKVQVGMIANYHKTFIKAEVPQFKNWVDKNYSVLKDRYKATYKLLNK